MKLAIIGTRDFNIYSQFVAKLKYHYPDVFTDKVTELVSGGREGIDQLVEILALRTSKPEKVFYPDYIKYSRNAPEIRNQEMADYADECIVIMNDFPIADKYYEILNAIDKFRRADKSVHYISLTDESFCIDWYKAMDSELPEHSEKKRRGGEEDCSFPHPPPRYRLFIYASTKIRGELIEGGYYQYRDEAEKVSKIIEKHYSYFFSSIEITIEENDSYE